MDGVHTNRHQWMKRLLIAAVVQVFLLTGQILLAQSTWTFSYQGTQCNNTIARDVVELGNGNWMVALGTDLRHSAIHKRSYVAILNSDGSLQTIKPLRYPDLDIRICTLLPSDTSSVIHALGASSDSVLQNGYGFAYYRIDHDLNFLDSARFVFDTTQFTTLENAVFDQRGNIFLAAGAVVDYPEPNRILLMTISQLGDSLSTNILGTGGGLTEPKQTITYHDNMMLATSGATIGPWGFGRFLEFDDQLQYVQGFATTSINGTGQPVPLDSVMRREMSFYALPGGNLLISAVWGLYSPSGYRAVVGKLTGTGVTVSYFFPRSSYFHDYPACLGGIAPIDERTFVFGMMENFDLYEDGPSPSRIHIYRMDTTLSVECEFVVDGFLDNAYYFLERVKVTSDGGTLLVGSRKDLSDPNAEPIAWVRKLGPEDCYVGVQEPNDTSSEVFPNPGSHEFTVLLSGVAVNGATLELFDTQGARVANVGLQNNAAQVHTGVLATGLYFYRIVDLRGRSVASGKWIKE